MIGGIIRGLYAAAAVKRTADEAKASLRRAVRRTVLCLAAAVLLACGAGFLIAAGYMALADEIGPVEASLAFGIGFALVGAAVLAAVAWRRRAPAPARLAAPAATSLTKPFLEIGQEIGAAASRNPVTLVLAAFVAGLLLSRNRR